MHAYEVAVVTVYALGVSWLTGIATAPGGRLATIGFLPAYAIVLALVCGYAILVLAPSSVVEASGRELVASLALGVPAGLLAIKSEDLLLRRARRSARERVGRRVPAAAVGQRPAGPRQGLMLLLLVATLEEVLYRGVLLQLSLSLPGEVARAAAVTALVLVFAATHLSFGWAQVIAKLPLSVAATTVVLASGAVLGAVVAHGLVNARSWRELSGGRA